MYNDDYYSSRQPFGPPFTPGGFGPGPGGPGFGPGGGFFGPPGGGGPPSGPPPAFTPTQQQGISVQAVDPGAIFNCRNRFTFIWLEGGRSFWAFITFVGRSSIAGWRWTGFFWVFFGLDLRRIQSFVCF